MSKNNRVKKEAKTLEKLGFSHSDMPIDIQEYKSRKQKITPKNETQRQYLSALQNNDDTMVIGAGSAGTGKTWLATSVACDLYRDNHFRELILTTPTVQCGEKLGHLPGELEDKYAPYIEPFEDVLRERLGNTFKNDYQKRIHAKPIQYMRGKTFDNSIVIIDEAQNTTIEQMKMVLTRIGEGTRLFITGDTSQTDLKKCENGLSWLVTQIKKQGLHHEVVEFTDRDSVRSDFCREMLKMIENQI